MWVAGTLCLSTLKYRSASEKGFSSIMASKNILLELSVLERLSHFATSNLNAHQEVARINRGLLCLARFLFQNASCQCHIYNWEAHCLDWGFGYASRGLSVNSVWQAATLLHACMQRRHILQWPCAKTYKTIVLASFFFGLWLCLVKVRNNEPLQNITAHYFNHFFNQSARCVSEGKKRRIWEPRKRVQHRDLFARLDTFSFYYIGPSYC